jgi:hypothetical protein
LFVTANADGVGIGGELVSENEKQQPPGLVA